MIKYDIIIIGAGAAGMIAAKTLCHANKRVCILEAQDCIGGRAHSLKKDGFTKAVEPGAEFIHGKLPLTIKLLKEAGIKYYETTGNLWQVKNNALIKRKDFLEHREELVEKLHKLNNDMSIAAFLKKYFGDEKYAAMKLSLKQYLEGYDAADINYASAFALKEEWEKEDDKQFRIEGGYAFLFEYLKDCCIKDECVTHLSTVVKVIRWKEKHAEVITSYNNTFAADKVIITVSVPILKNPLSSAGISFEPALPVIHEAASQIGFGGVIKIVTEFTHAFWEAGKVRKAKNLFFVFSEETVPTWWSHVPDKTPILSGWLAGPNANKLADACNETILQDALQSLSNIFGLSIEELKLYITGTHVHNWVADPLCKGGYSYNTITTKAAKNILRTPVANTLFFAGEALSKHSNATVDAALESGKEVAEWILGNL